MKPSPWMPGHFYSPIPGDDDIERAIEAKQTFSWSSTFRTEVDSICKRTDDLVLKDVDTLVKYFLAREKLYPIESRMFTFADALALWGLIATIKPKRIIEVGSGHSTALMLDAKRFQEVHFQLTCIEPFPSRLRETLGTQISEVELVELPVQAVGHQIYESLNADDLLFIDSSHVSKAGSDVNHLMFNVLPYVCKGCYVHIHDIFKGFEYPATWLKGGRSWNEAYLLRAFLMYNSAFSIHAWPQLLSKPSSYSKIAELLSHDFEYPGSSIYLRKSF